MLKRSKMRLCLLAHKGEIKQKVEQDKWCIGTRASNDMWRQRQVFGE